MHSQLIVQALGVEWANRRYDRCDELIPRQWPGTLNQARQVVLERARGELDPTEVDEIAAEVHRIAQETWWELISAEVW